MGDTPVNSYSSIYTQLISWWIYHAPKNLFRAILQVIKNSYNYFSITLLAKTLFSPWRRDVVNPVNPSLQDRLQIFVMNLFSRIIGAIVRLITIIIGLIIIALEFLFGVIVYIAFVFMPFLAILIFIAAIL